MTNRESLLLELELAVATYLGGVMLRFTLSSRDGQTTWVTPGMATG